MKLVTWNIKQGGTGSRFDSIISHLLEHGADLIILTEFWVGDEGDHIKKGLYDAGYIYQDIHTAPFKMDCVFAASKIPFQDVTDMNEYAVPYERWVDLYFPEKDLQVLGIHIPNTMIKLQDKEVFWQELIEYARKHKDGRCVIIGDYNTGLPEDTAGLKIECLEYLKELNAMGWIDSWRYTHKDGKQVSWHSYSGQDWRIDHAYISPSLSSQLVQCHYSHQERIDQSSDHSALVIELNDKGK
ncbi:endonuclease/exonuclease/phosphatase family protein [Bacillus sp. 1P06AnD]|uniref:endonuclease/exonuclease/phosphatase family protein n=1 Tax=Bacillus sp. 1P06AnD TaxID=3132208 RepID=UPI0039A039BE